jgi:hypothetical protein
LAFTRGIRLVAVMMVTFVSDVEYR